MSDRYNAQEFDTVAYMSTSGGLGCPDSDARGNYYNVGGIPHVVFGGTTNIVGAGTDAINGSVYDPIVQSMLDDPTPVKLTITDYDFGATPYVTFAVELEGDLADISQTELRVAILENDLSFGGETYVDVLRDLLPDVSLTIDQAGQMQQETVDFGVDGSWIVDNLRLIVFVQDDATKHIYQMATTRPAPDYTFRYYAFGERTVVDEGAVTFDDCALFNTGALADTYTIGLDTSELPAGWSGHFTYLGVNYTTLDLALAPGERAIMNVTVDAASTGSGTAVLTMHAQSGGPDDRQLAYSIITADTEILLVDDDGAFDYETEYYAPALATTGRSFAIWDRNSTALSGTLLSNFDVVIWECGFAFPTVDDDDRAALAEYLDGGGRLFLTGQDIGWELNDIGGAAITWYHDYLHANFVNDDTNDNTLDGVPDDPISDGLALTIAGGDGANNQDYPSDIDPRDEYASTIFTYDASRNGAIKADTGAYRVVYFAFGYEAIDNPDDRAVVMQRIVDWLVPGSTAVGTDLLPAPIALRGNVPNPFNPRTEIAFSLGAETRIELAVFDLQGRRLRVLESGLHAAGEHHVIWDGRDSAGRDLPSGTYFYRLQGAGQNQAHKMSLVR